MTQGFFQFNDSIINEINNFTTSSYDLLFFSGKEGSSKSETIEKAIEEFSEDILVFKHFCFKNSEIDDFLLNFYDLLRDFSLAEKITLKKFVTDNFKEKVSHYFKSISRNCVIIVENFENVDENSEIVDFLSHLATYDNVKIIIVTRNGEKNLFEFKKLKIINLPIQPLSKQDFKTKLVLLAQPLTQEIQDKYYEATSGLDLYLKMAVRYCSLTNFSMADFMNEFERQKGISNIEFDKFLISKYITLIPRQYLIFFKTLCTIPIPVGSEFIDFYKLTEVKDGIEYLSQKFLINFFGNKIFVKDYFRKYTMGTFTVHEKVTYYTKLLKIYEEELTKSPKDRLIRLSRESIRKEAEYITSLIPAINSPKSSSFAYLNSQADTWQDEKTRQKARLAEKMNKIKERKNFLLKNQSNTIKKEYKQETKNETKQNIIELLNFSRKYTSSYKYKEAIQELSRALEYDKEKEFEIEILIMMGKNYETLNNFDTAVKIYTKALKSAAANNDERKSELKYLIACINKKLYKTQEAKEQFFEITGNESDSINFRRKSYIELGEIFEAEQDMENASICYQGAINISLGKDKQIASKAYYRLATMFDENGDIDEAIKYYQKNYITSSDYKDNKYYSSSLVNLALIYSENSNYKEALDCLKLALAFDDENNDLENLYYTQKEIAKLYFNIDEISSINYYKQALTTAKKLNDNFKTALIYFEFAQNYYDKGIDDKALINFFNARILLKKSSDQENLSLVETRIKDIKMRIDKNTYDLIAKNYE